MSRIKINLENSGIKQESILEYKDKVEIVHKSMKTRANEQNDFVGWLELPTKYDKKEFERIKKVAKKIKEESDILVVIRNRRIIFRSKSSNRITNKFFL